MRFYRSFVSMSVGLLAGLLSLNTPGQAHPISLDEAERTVAQKGVASNAKLLPLPQHLITALSFEGTDLNQLKAQQQSVHSFLTEMGFQHVWSDQYYAEDVATWYSAERDTTIICLTFHGHTSQLLAYQLNGKVGRHDDTAW